MHNSIEYSDYYSKTCGGLCQYHRNESNDDITNSESFKFKAKIRTTTKGKTTKDGNTNNVEKVNH